VRLGKFMSKARVTWEAISVQEAQDGRHTVPALLNPADLGPDTHLLTFDLVNIPPTPLVRNATLDGPFYRLGEHEWLPAGMRFGVERL